MPYASQTYSSLRMISSNAPVRCSAFEAMRASWRERSMFDLAPREAWRASGRRRTEHLEHHPLEDARTSLRGLEAQVVLRAEDALGQDETIGEVPGPSRQAAEQLDPHHDPRKAVVGHAGVVEVRPEDDRFVDRPREFPLEHPQVAGCLGRLQDDLVRAVLEGVVERLRARRSPRCAANSGTAVGNGTGWRRRSGGRSAGGGGARRGRPSLGRASRARSPPSGATYRRTRPSRRAGSWPRPRPTWGGSPSRCARRRRRNGSPRTAAVPSGTRPCGRSPWST